MSHGDSTALGELESCAENDGELESCAESCAESWKAMPSQVSTAVSDTAAEEVANLPMASQATSAGIDGTWADMIRKGVLLLLGIWMGLCGGTLYVFSAWEEQLMGQCRLSVRQLDFVYAMGQLGTGLGLVPGAIYDNYGPRATALYALLLTLSGNLGLHLVLQVDGCGGHIHLGLLYLVLQNGSAALYQAGLFSNLRSSALAIQGKVAGIVAAGFGLSAAFWSVLYENVLAGDLGNYFLSTAAIFGSTALLASLALPYLMRSQRGASTGYGKLGEDAVSSAAIGTVGKPQLDVQDVNADRDANVCETSAEQVKCSLGHILRSADFWAFVIMFACVQAVGSGIFIANLALMGRSLGVSEGSRLALVQVVSYSSCGGRAAAGFFLDELEKRGVPRVAHAVWTSGLMMLVTSVLCFAPDEFLQSLLFPLIILVGIVYGANWTIAPSFLAVRFGHDNVGCCFNIAASLLGLTVVMTAYAVGVLYDTAAADQTSAELSKTDGGAFCKGAGCWHSAYLLGLGLSTLGLGAACLGAHLAIRRQREV